jgi:hypothetical protein
MFVNRQMRPLELWSIMDKMSIAYCTLAIVLQIQGDFPSYVIVTSFYGGGDRTYPAMAAARIYKSMIFPKLSEYAALVKVVHSSSSKSTKHSQTPPCLTISLSKRLPWQV